VTRSSPYWITARRSAGQKDIGLRISVYLPDIVLVEETEQSRGRGMGVWDVKGRSGRYEL